jgi:hypothetical protein
MILQWTFIVTTEASESRFDGEFVTVVGPPAIDAQGFIGAVSCPVFADVEGGVAFFGDRRAEESRGSGVFL